MSSGSDHVPFPPSGLPSYLSCKALSDALEWKPSALIGLNPPGVSPVEGCGPGSEFGIVGCRPFRASGKGGRAEGGLVEGCESIEWR